MFTGLIQDVGTVRSIDKNGDWRIVIETGLDLEAALVGASIACNGCCLTVVEKGESWFAVEVSAESLSKTVIKNWQEGARVNLEPSLKLGDELGGHIVSGHVDGVVTLVSVESEGDSQRLKIRALKDLARFIAPKGSVALDGVSLTVNEVEGNVFGVNIIPHTWDHTNLSDKRVGDTLNIEIDMLARYVARMLEVAA
ncbi:MAG: riboflavin synthase [Rhodospirillales bacterium]|nr:riboflavin synthase [Alphaproteobacteria bacterium]MCB9980780.1 riboflavin synthase [Rhodospirillales bacterium]